MTRDGSNILAVLRAAILERVGPARYEFWLGAGQWLDLVEGSLTVTVPNEFYASFVRRNLRTALEAARTEILGQSPALVVATAPAATLNESVSAPAGLDSAPAEHVSAGAENSGAPLGPDVNPRATLVKFPGTVPGPTSAFPAPRVVAKKNISAGSPVEETFAAPGDVAAFTRRAPATLDDFIPGNSNRVALGTAQTAALHPGEITPLLFFGPTGMGKTHLLRGIAERFNATSASRTAIVFTGEQFTCAFQAALHGSGMPSFRRKFRQVDMLLVDDIHFLKGKKHTADEFLVTVDGLLRQGRQVVLGSALAPAELGEFGAALASRLGAGMSCRLAPPDFAARRAILRQLARQAQFEIPDDVQELIVARVMGSARELIGALNRLKATSRATSQPITRTLAESVVAEMIRQQAPAVRLTDIDRAVCEVFGLEPSELQSESKSKGTTYPRMLAMYLARKYTRAALAEIGNYFGRRSHSTVHSAERRIRAGMSEGASIDIAQGQWPIEEALHRVEQRLRLA